MVKIATFETNLYRIPLPTPVRGASTGIMSDFDMVMVRLTDDDGVEGTGYTAVMLGKGHPSPP